MKIKKNCWIQICSQCNCNATQHILNIWLFIYFFFKFSIIPQKLTKRCKSHWMICKCWKSPLYSLKNRGWWCCCMLNIPLINISLPVSSLFFILYSFAWFVFAVWNVTRCRIITNSMLLRVDYSPYYDYYYYFYYYRIISIVFKFCYRHHR